MNIAERRTKLKDSVICAELDNEAVLLDVETGIYFGLDAIGTEIWKLLEEGLAETEIVARLLQEYEVEADQLRQDVREFLQALEENGLISSGGE